MAAVCSVSKQALTLLVCCRPDFSRDQALRKPSGQLQLETPMIGLIQTAMLFTRGMESVRLLRMTRADGPARLLVDGPGHAQATLVLDNAIDCLWQQTDIERALVEEGFQVVTRVERRSGRDRRTESRGSDRRRSRES